MKTRGQMFLKTLVIGLLCLLNINIMQANNALPLSPDSDTRLGFILINERDITFKMKQEDFQLLLTNIEYNDKNKYLTFIANKEINFVQILDQKQEIIFQLPIFSTELNLDINDLETGQYHINLVTTGPYLLIPGEIVKKF